MDFLYRIKAIYYDEGRSEWKLRPWHPVFPILCVILFAEMTLTVWWDFLKIINNRV